jgi:hypothetical protein
MNVVDLHPDDLLDKDASGRLTDSERIRLEAHVQRCHVCRLEREVRADFAAELESGEELSAPYLIALIGSETTPADQRTTANGPSADVADRLGAPKAGGAPRSGIADEAARFDVRARRRTVRMVLLVAAALFVGSAATAAAGARVWASLSSVWADEPAESPAQPQPVPVVSAAAFVPQQRMIVDASSSAMADPQTVAMADPSSEKPSPPLSQAAVSPSAVDSPGVLFEAANEARRQGDYARAIHLSRRLQMTHPASREAHVSHATVGRLLLDRGDVAGALISFDAYQARGPGWDDPSLDEAVMVGRATSLERLGRLDDASRAWRALLTAFPETPYAEHARVRVAASSIR